MTFDEIFRDVQALEEELNSYERKYSVLSETFYESYVNGEEPADDVWVLDWNDWAGLYEIWLERHQQYTDMISALKKQTPLSELIKRAAHRESISLPS